MRCRRTYSLKNITLHLFKSKINTHFLIERQKDKETRETERQKDREIEKSEIER